MKRVRLLTRGSSLARVQTELAVSLLRAAVPEAVVEVAIVGTYGDRSRAPLATAGGAVGVFVKELQEGLLRGDGDIAVHSLKDLPTIHPDGLELAAVLEREDPRDAIVTRDGRGLASLSEGAVVATSSPRRRAQLLAARPDLRLVDVRGNVPTRLEKLDRGEFDALVLACAGLYRLGLGHRISEALPPQTMLPAPGQAAIALEARSGSEAAALAATIDHRPTRAAVEAERALLLALGGGCLIPVGALGRVVGQKLELEGVVADPDSGEIVRDHWLGSTAAPHEIGRQLAERLRASGATAILARAPGVKPLANKRIVNTRQGASGAALSEALSQLGAEVADCPAIALAPPENDGPLRGAALEAETFAAIAFTSANAVAPFADALRAAEQPLDTLGAIAAVGSATASALRDHGFEVAVEAGGAGGGVLAEELISCGLAGVGKRVLLPRARDGHPGVVSALAACGAEVVEVEAYRTVTPADLDCAVRAALRQPVDAVLFASPSAVENFVAAMDEEQLARLRSKEVVIACIGETTAAAAAAHGLAVAVQPQRASNEELVGALVRHYAEQEQEG